jgi:hypothetical protein
MAHTSRTKQKRKIVESEKIKIRSLAIHNLEICIGWAAFVKLWLKNCFNIPNLIFHEQNIGISYQSGMLKRYLRIVCKDCYFILFSVWNTSSILTERQSEKDILVSFFWLVEFCKNNLLLSVGFCVEWVPV